MVQWLRCGASTAGGTGSIPGWGTKIPNAKQVQKINKNFKTYILLLCKWLIFSSLRTIPND